MTEINNEFFSWGVSLNDKHNNIECISQRYPKLKTLFRRVKWFEINFRHIVYTVSKMLEFDWILLNQYYLMWSKFIIISGVLPFTLIIAVTTSISLKFERLCLFIFSISLISTNQNSEFRKLLHLIFSETLQQIPSEVKRVE